MRDDQRPLSPHLQVYKLPLAALLSITHRATGVFLSLGGLVFVYWFACLAAGPAKYMQVQDFLGSAFGQLLLFAWSASLYLHLCNGIRHLVWDAGYGFEKDKVDKSNLYVLGGTVVLTVATWIASIVVRGA